MSRSACVADIFQEVDEEVRRERLEQLWKKHGNLIVAVALVILAAIGGWRGYMWWQDKKAAEAGAAFEAASTLADEGKHQEAEAAFAKLAAEGTPGYRALARFREAAQLALHDPKAAVGIYEALASDASLDRLLQDLAAVRARLEPLAAADRPFRHSARELLALSAWRSGDGAAARRWIDSIVGDPETPAGIRNRVEVLLALIPTDGKG